MNMKLLDLQTGEYLELWKNLKTNLTNLMIKLNNDLSV